MAQADETQLNLPKSNGKLVRSDVKGTVTSTRMPRLSRPVLLSRSSNSTCCSGSLVSALAKRTHGPHSSPVAGWSALHPRVPRKHQRPNKVRLVHCGHTVYLVHIHACPRSPGPWAVVIGPSRRSDAERVLRVERLSSSRPRAASHEVLRVVSQITRMN